MSLASASAVNGNGAMSNSALGSHMAAESAKPMSAGKTELIHVVKAAADHFQMRLLSTIDKSGSGEFRRKRSE